MASYRCRGQLVQRDNFHMFGLNQFESTKFHVLFFEYLIVLFLLIFFYYGITETASENIDFDH